MSTRTIIALAGLACLFAAIALPPLWFKLFPAKLPELPPPETFVSLPSGSRMHAIIRGDGIPVVLVHGLPGQASEWRSVIDLLADKGRRVIAIDRLGYGHSDPRPGHEFTLEANARDLRELLDALALSDVTVVGWSYGGGTSITAARQQATASAPPRIARIVLVASVGPAGGTDSVPRPPAATRVLRLVLPWMRSIPPLALAGQRSYSTSVLFSDQPPPQWWLDDFAANQFQAKTQRALDGEADQLLAAPVPDTKGLALPILVIQGDADRLVPVEVGRGLAAAAPRATFVEVPGGSHMLPITHPELLAAQIAAFSSP